MRNNTCLAAAMHAQLANYICIHPYVRNDIIHAVYVSIYGFLTLLPPTNFKHQLVSCYHLHEMEKRRQYDERVWEVERGSFAPLVFATCGGIGQASNRFVFFTNACLPAGIEEGPALQPRDWLDQMPLPWVSLFSVIFHHLPEG